MHEPRVLIDTSKVIIIREREVGKSKAMLLLLRKVVLSAAFALGLAAVGGVAAVPIEGDARSSYTEKM